MMKVQQSKNKMTEHEFRLQPILFFVQVWSGQPWVLVTWTASRGSTTRWWLKPRTWADREEAWPGALWLKSLSLMSTTTLPASLRVRQQHRRSTEYIWGMGVPSSLHLVEDSGSPDPALTICFRMHSGFSLMLSAVCISFKAFQESCKSLYQILILAQGLVLYLKCFCPAQLRELFCSHNSPEKHSYQLTNWIEVWWPQSPEWVPPMWWSWLLVLFSRYIPVQSSWIIQVRLYRWENSSHW